MLRIKVLSIVFVICSSYSELYRAIFDFAALLGPISSNLLGTRFHTKVEHGKNYIKIGAFRSLLVKASGGDWDPSYRECVWYCHEHECKEEDIPLIQRRLLQWECIDECQYTCMRNISDHYLKLTGKVPKYYGHWPFVRVFLMQEPAAALFSAANIAPHVYYLWKYWSQLSAPNSNYLYGKFLIGLSIISINAWLASVLYHTRKLPSTALYDYSSALVLLASNIWLAAYRLSIELKWRKTIINQGLFGLCSVFLLCFVARWILDLYQGTITFSDHMKRCIGLVVSQLVLWLAWIIISVASHKYWCLLSQLWLAAAGTLEIFDFPPYFGHFDAHSLWHAATVPLGFILYHFWIQDVQYLYNSHIKLTDSGGGESNRNDKTE